MILKIRNNSFTKVASYFMILVFLSTLNPSVSYGLTGGPAQPEFSAFTPIGTSDMVDLGSGDFSYNLPLLDVGGFPINLAYSSGVSMDQEASWVGLGWDLSIGQINRQMRGLPDDFAGEEVQYEKNIKENYTVGAGTKINAALFGVDAIKGSIGVTAKYNSYNGVSISPSAGISFDIANMVNLGLNVSADENGLSISPNLGISTKIKGAKNRDLKLGSSIGASFNSRQGLSNLNMSSSASITKDYVSEGVLKEAVISSLSSRGSSVSYVNNTYTPSVNDGLDNVSATVNVSGGGEVFGVEPQVNLSGFASTQIIAERYRNRVESAYGYDHTHQGNQNKRAVLDFNREKDGNFSKNTVNLPVTNYTYDIYSVKGQGVGGMFRPYRSQVGYVNDNFVSNNSEGGTFGAEIGGGQAVHAGLDLELTSSTSEAGLWENNNEALRTFKSDENLNPKYEEVYYKNVGDLSVDEDSDVFGSSSQNLGGYSPLYIPFSTDKFHRKLLNKFNIKHPTIPRAFNHVNPLDEESLKRSERVRKNQSITKISMSEAKVAGDLIGFNLNESSEIADNQTAGFIVTRNDGARYIYGEALYNITKREVTFSVGKKVGGEIIEGADPSTKANLRTGLTEYEPGVDNSVDNKKGDQYFERITTPIYAHTYLLTTLLSTDYSDVDGNGPSENDLGSYTKFEYRRLDNNYKWRVPFQLDSANYNQGILTDKTDDKASYMYGEKEVGYIKRIDTKTHVALFYCSPREDAYGVLKEDGGKNIDVKMYKLDSVALYSTGEVIGDAEIVDGLSYGNCMTTATPIKTVIFEYNYDLCKNIPNGANATQGKLTLKEVYFRYRDSNLGKYSGYKFQYCDKDHDGEMDSALNPNYNLKGYDIWGNYKPNKKMGLSAEGGILEPLTAPEFNYVEQDDLANDYTAAWTLTDIHLPSGGIIKVDYESDDYQYVQDKTAMRMFKLAGVGSDLNPSGEDYFDVGGVDGLGQINQGNEEDLLYTGLNEANEAKYVYVKLAKEEQQMPFITAVDKIAVKQKFYENYLQEIIRYQKELIQFRVFTNFNRNGGKNSDAWKSKGEFDFVSGYFEFDSGLGYDVFEWEDTLYGSVPMKQVDMEGYIGRSGRMVNPISKASWHYGRKYLPKYIYDLPSPDPSSGVEAIANTLKGATDGLKDMFKGPNGSIRDSKMCRRIIPEKSWVRLMNPNKNKLGGGSRVKKLEMTDEWTSMTPGDLTIGQEYGQEYTYALSTGGSSGVATYEPVGSKENPLVQPVYVNVNRLLAPDEENYMEKPFGESFFPSPTITYSSVTVKNLERIEGENKVEKHATGKVVTEFFTSKDYPVKVDQTALDIEEDEPRLIATLLNINHKKHITGSQGYLVHLNDMNGKMKSQRVYAEGHEGEDDFISGADYHYDHFTSEDGADPFNAVSHNPGVLNNSVDVVYPDGKIKKKTLGVEYDVINDFREMKSTTEVVGLNTNLATFFIGVFPGLIPLPLPDYAFHEDKMNISVTTKVINTFGIQREVIAYDAGAAVFTRNLLWDAYSGDVLLTETVNEYGDKYYSFNYPAHWYYKGMSLASLNGGMILKYAAGGTILDAEVPGYESDYLFKGDEVILLDEDLDIGTPRHAWINNVTGFGFSMIDETGAPVAPSEAGSMKIIRSGRRNLQSTSMGSVVMRENPMSFFGAGQIPPNFLITDEWNKYKIVNAGAVDFSERWNDQCECGVVAEEEVENKYVKNKKGVYRANRSHLYLTGRHQQADSPNPRNDGFYNSFRPFYGVDGGGNWGKHDANWQSTSEITNFSPFGFELENRDALDRYSSAQYGYNYSFPMAVAANSQYKEMGYDGFEEYGFGGCSDNAHFGFRDAIADTTSYKSHTGRYSLKITAGSTISESYRVACEGIVIYEP
ncbi:hypothetical protein [Crocinitomix catalasitica]|uniref:hypothetical protein n=1 Tax=Crocinitomix catalasitica TaxID=184607 RepID=UPI000485CC58|nr:hypothetical protein [Crocinitomix catalasitica]